MKKTALILLIAVVAIGATGCTSAERIEGLEAAYTATSVTIDRLEASLAATQEAFANDPENAKLAAKMESVTTEIEKYRPYLVSLGNEIAKAKAGGGEFGLIGGAMTTAAPLAGPYAPWFYLIGGLVTALGGKKIHDQGKAIKTVGAKYKAHKRGVQAIIRDPAIDTSNLDSVLYDRISEERAKLGIK